MWDKSSGKEMRRKLYETMLRKSRDKTRIMSDDVNNNKLF
jgi:hypothetical protein